MSKIDYLGLVNADHERVRHAAFRIIDAIQTEPSFTQTAAVAATFLLLCGHFKVDPQDVFVATKNMLAQDRNDGRWEFEAVRNYIRYEVPTS